MARIFEEIAALKEALEKDPQNTQALIRLGNLFHDSGKYDQAVGLYERALQKTPHDVNVRTDMAICLREVGKIDEAIAHFRESLSHDPEHWQTWLNLGIVSLYDKNDFVTAAEAFTQLERFNPAFKDLPLLKEAVRKAESNSSRKAS